VDAKGTGGFFGEANPVIADAKTHITGHSSELPDVAFAGLGKALQC